MHSTSSQEAMITSEDESSAPRLTGLVKAVNGDVFETVEGNKNKNGSSKDNGVYARTRNFRLSKLDVFSIEPLCAL